jgi:hypothetical protein
VRAVVQVEPGEHFGPAVSLDLVRRLCIQSVSSHQLVHGTYDLLRGDGRDVDPGKHAHAHGLDLAQDHLARLAVELTREGIGLSVDNRHVGNGWTATREK